MAFVRPGLVPPTTAEETSAAVIENLTALAAGMAVGKVYKVAAVRCPHRKRVLLQQIHDAEGEGGFVKALHPSVVWPVEG